MAHPLDGNCYRYTFIFKKENMEGNLNKKFQDYISMYRMEVEEQDRAGVTSGCNIHVYEDVLIIEDEHTRIAPVTILVFYGSDWTNFIDDLLAFQELFPTSVLPRENDYNFVLRDERRIFDDFK